MNNKFLILLVFFCIILSPTNLVMAKEETKMNKLINEIKKTVVFLGKFEEKNGKKETRINATGFLVNIRNVYHLVTAKHVVMEVKNNKFTGKLLDEDMYAFYNIKIGGLGFRSISSIKKQYNINWIFHKTENVDVAIIPFPIEPKTDDIKVIPESLFLDVKRLFELYDIFFLSFQPGIKFENKVTPIIRSGNISLMNNDKTFYIDASAFPGNSGSPVFLKPSPIRFDVGGITLGGDELGGKFIGIIGEYLPYQEVAISAQTGRPRVIFEENTGLSKVWSVFFINEIIDSDEFKKQLEKFIKKQ